MISFVMGEFTMLKLWKYGFRVSEILFGLYSTNYKVYFRLSCINTKWRTTAPFELTHVISSSDRQITRLYQGSDNRCEGDRNSNIIYLLQPSKTINYCNQSVLVIVPDLNIFVWTITIVYPISRKCPGAVLSITC